MLMFKINENEEEWIMSSDNEKKCDSGLHVRELFIGGVIGGAAGAIVALLLAPKTGEEFRQGLNLKGRLEEGVDKAKELTSGILQKDDEPFS